MSAMVIDLESGRTFAALHLTDLPDPEILFSPNAVREYADDDGKRWRRAFAVTLRLEEPARFRIHLRDVASSDDLTIARAAVARTRRDGLTRTGSDGNPLWAASTLGGYLYRPYVRQDGHDRHIDVLRECAVPESITQWHAWQDGEQGELCELEPIRRDWHSVFGFRAQGGLWEASASTFSDPPEGPQGLRAIRDLANDYAWMLGECDRLNAAVRVNVGAT